MEVQVSILWQWENLISCPLSYQASLSEPHRYHLGPSNQIFFRLFPQLNTYKMSHLSFLSLGGWDVLFRCPWTDRDGIKKMGQGGVAYTTKVVTGSLPKLMSTPPGFWTSYTLWNKWMLQTQIIRWKAGDWSQYQVVPSSCLWYVLAIWPLTN